MADEVGEPENPRTPAASDHRVGQVARRVVRLLRDVHGDVVPRERPRRREERHAERPACRPARLVVHDRGDVPRGVDVRRCLDREPDRHDEQDDGAQCRRPNVEPGEGFGQQADDQVRYKHHRRIHQLRRVVRNC